LYQQTLSPLFLLENGANCWDRLVQMNDCIHHNDFTPPINLEREIDPLLAHQPEPET